MIPDSIPTQLIHTSRPTNNMANPIPAFYRVLFTIIDPLLPLGGLVIHTLFPAFTLHSYVAAPVLPAAPETQFLLDYTAGFFASLAFLQAVLLRARPHDVTVWKILQASTIFVDIFVVGGFLRSLSAQGRLDYASWRAEDMQNIFGNAAIGLLRLAFCLGVGLGESGKSAPALKRA